MGTKEFTLLKASAFTQKVDEAKAELEQFNQNAIAQAATDAAASAAEATANEVKDQLGGATGVFTSADGKTITVEDGIIKTIV